MKDNYLQELPKPKDKFCPLFSKGISVGNQIFIAEFNKKKKTEYEWITKFDTYISNPREFKWRKYNISQNQFSRIKLGIGSDTNC